MGQFSVDGGDSVWVVADGDVNYRNPDPVTAKDGQLARARKMAEAKGIQIAISNPCFEFWYLLHFQYTTRFLKDYPAVKAMLTVHLPDYEKSDYIRLIRKAVEYQNKNQIQIYNNANLPFSIGVNPFTDVYHLVESLI